jgi:hypothetical protein
MLSDLLRLPVVVPHFFLEACGYRGTARYVAARWHENLDELWLTDDGHAIRGVPGPMAGLWRRDGGPCALERFRTEAATLGRPPWLLFDRDRREVYVGDAFDVWRELQGRRPGVG